MAFSRRLRMTGTKPDRAHWGCDQTISACRAGKTRCDVAVWPTAPISSAPQVIAAAESRSRQAYEELFAATDTTYPRFKLAEYQVAHEGVWHSPGRTTVLVWATDAAETIRGTLDSIADQSELEIDLVLVDSNSTDATAHVAKQWIAANERRFGSVTLMRTAGVEPQGYVLNAIFDRSRTPYVVVVGAGSSLSREFIFEMRTTTDLTCAAIVRTSADVGGISEGDDDLEPWRFPSKRGQEWAVSMTL